jgi:hypothetical protein
LHFGLGKVIYAVPLNENADISAPALEASYLFIWACGSVVG